MNSLDGCQNSGKIIRTGNGTSLEFKQEVSYISSNDIDEIILVKDNAILPGVDGFSSGKYPRKPHSIPKVKRIRGINVDPPQIMQGLVDIPATPKV